MLMRTPVARLLLWASVLAVPSCSGAPIDQDPPVEVESTVRIETTDSQTLTGRVAEVTDRSLIVTDELGGRATVPREVIRKLEVVSKPPAASTPEATLTLGTPEAERAAPRAPEVMEIVVPAGTTLNATLDSRIASDSSRVEDEVTASLSEPVSVIGREVIPAGSTLVGSVIEARRSARVKGRARLAFRFHTVRIAGSAEEYRIRSAPIAREAEGTKSEDAKKVGIPAAGGAIVGGILGGKKGAAIGGAVGGGAGAAVVLNTRGDEVTFGEGDPVRVKLSDALAIQIQVGAR